MNPPIQLLLASLFLLTGCAATPKYLEKTSEALSRSVYATGDSLVLGRVELAKEYNEATQKLVPPPNLRVVIKPVRSGASSIITLPETYKGSLMVNVGTEEYAKLVQVTEENKVLSEHLLVVDQERKNQYEINNQLIKDYQSSVITIANLGKTIAEKNLHIIILYIILAGIAALIGLGIYLKALVPMKVW